MRESKRGGCTHLFGHAGKNVRGYSLVELLVVLGIIALLTVISLPYLVNYTKMYKSEDQAIKVMDLMRETAQLALNRRRTIRFELDRSNAARPQARIIDENNGGTAIVIKSIPLEPLNEVRMDVPSGITPPNPPNYANIGYLANVWSARFRSDGTVVNAANTPISATLYSWPPAAGGSTPRRMQEVRAITIFGGSGAVRYWKYNGSSFVPYQ
ncbi:MAG TPA: type II secretion system protein [Pyrinomonadaceae bacterium]|nr:type II secretion system protein [Pyrinomonadaceae bacterium]